jgi:cell division protein FtsL
LNTLIMLAFALVCSVGVNAYLWFSRDQQALSFQSKITGLEGEITKLKTEPQPTLEAKQILHDLTRGEALVRIRRVDPDDVLVRSPRGRV